MNKKITKLIAALALLVFMTPSMAGWGQTKTDPTYEWVLVEDYSSLSTSETYVIAGNVKGGSTWYSLKNEQVTSNTNLSVGSTLTINNNKITSTVSDDETWVLEAVANQTDQFYIKSTKGNYYLQNEGNTGSKITTKSNTDGQNKWKIHYTVTYSNGTKSVTGLYNVGVTRIFGCYSSSNWRCYASANYSNLESAEVVLYKRQVVTTDPTITLSKTSLTGFNYVQGAGPSASQSFKVSGTNLEGDITVSLGENSNYEMSEQDGDNWLSITSKTLTQTDGTVIETTLYVRMKSGLTGNEINGTITASSEDATSKTITLSGSVTPTYTLTYSATNGNISGVIGTTAVESGAALVEGTQVALTAEPSEGYRFVEWSVSGTNATLSSTTDNPTTFTMGTADATVTATFEVIPTHTVTFSVNGTTTSNDVLEGAAIVFPSDPEGINGMSFMGWVTATIPGTTNEAPSFVTSATMGTSDITYYAVFANVTSGTVTKTDTLTLATTGVSGNSYSSWTNKQATNNSHSEAVYAGCTAGGNSSIQLNASTSNSKRGIISTTSGGKLKKVTITWNSNSTNGRSVTIYGKNKAYTSVSNFNNDKGTELGKITKGTSTELTITCDSTFIGFSATDAIYMSNIVIDWETTGTVYSAYCTTVLAVLPPVITVAANPFVISTTATITCATPQATIKYSFDNENWENYSTALTITTATTIYAKALKGGDESTISSVEVTKNLAEPTVTIDASGITNTNVFNGTDAGSLTATVTYNETPIEGATVTWSGNNDEVATIDASTGAVTLVAVGSVDFTATYAGNSDYSEKTASYNLTVTNVDPNGLGTRNNPYTVAQAKELMANWTQNTQSSADVYVSGIICNVGSFNNTYKSITYWISDDGTTTSSIQVYSGKGLNGADFAEADDLAVNEQVIVKGKLYKYKSGNNLIDEINANSIQVFYAYVYGNNDEKVDCYRVIESYSSDADGYYLVASPINMSPAYTVTVDDNTYSVGMITDDGTDPDNRTYDLYLFDQSRTLEWCNYRNWGFDIVPGKGYLYANKDNVTINFWGEPTVTSTTLSKVEDAVFEGVNLVGNPLGTKAYIDRSFYIMNNDGSEIIVSPRNYIFPMEGVFVVAENNNETLNFDATAPSSNPGKGNLNIQVAQKVANRGAKLSYDKAVVRFDESGILPKFMLNPGNTKLYITQNGKDYAVVNAQSQGEMPVNFKARENGTYTLTVNPENVEMNYLHLIDNMTGADIDLLQTPSYSFNATTNDYESRFKLVFATNNEDGASTGSAAFAFYSNGNWIINNAGEATLQVVDLMGRILSSETVNGSVSKTINATPGVYMLRLINGENVKVQKVVIE